MNLFKLYFAPAQDGPPAQAQTQATGVDSQLERKDNRQQQSDSKSLYPTPSIEITPVLSRNNSRSKSQPSLLSPSMPWSRFSQPPSTQQHASVSQRPSPVAPAAEDRRQTPTPKSQLSSVRTSVFTAHDMRGSTASLVDFKTDVMVTWLYEQQLRKQYVARREYAFEGAVLKKARGSFVCCPAPMRLIHHSLYEMVTHMNVRCAMTVHTPVVQAILRSIDRVGLAAGAATGAAEAAAGIDFVPLPEGLRVQVLRTMADLPRCKLHQFAAFVQDVGMLIVWDDEPESLLARAAFLEAQLVRVVWGTGQAIESGGEEMSEEKMDEDAAEVDPAQLREALAREHRPVQLWSAGMVATTLALCITCLGLGCRALVLEIMVDGAYARLAFVAVAPAQFFVSLFFFQALVGNIFQIFGPISAVTSNSKYYSGKPPKRLNPKFSALPHVSIQMPVYKEGLDAVIKPTVASLKAAISTYEMQGGTANIFVNDDGMQVITPEEAQARRDFYDEHNIGWVARPGHCPKPDTEKGEARFLRRGKFKKASNMNYALMVSNRVEEKLSVFDRGPRWSQEQENEVYWKCLADVLEEDEGRTWAEGNIRIGDYILLIDSDTRVPKDCLLDAVSEMEQSPDVAIIQFSSGVMNVTNSFFENGVTWFTRLIYTAITFAVASGDACPFVGHNAILRWRAIQDAASYTDEDGYEKFWSESHVSEDFDMALRLQVRGYSLRYASYTGGGFKEGVSLTVYDELARWEKYAYGCNELLFHPLRYWITRGPFTRLFRQFLFSCIPLPKKLTIVAYIGTYYAIAAAWSLTLANYFLTGWFSGHYDKYYLDSFAIYISIIVIFTGLGNVALAALRYRTCEQSLLGSFLENLKWIPMFTIFLGGLSMHVSQAILCHFLGVEMNWGATAKEYEEVHFATEFLKIVRRFKFTFLFCFACTGLMVAGYFFFPHEWQIRAFFSIYPLASLIIAHFALPVLLNPALMMFTW